MKLNLDELIDTLRKRDKRKLCSEEQQEHKDLLRSHELKKEMHKVLAQTSTPATIQDYINWLYGYMSKGKLPSHVYHYPMDRVLAKWYVVHSDTQIIPLYGANSVNLIIRPGVIISGKLGHSIVYYMKNFSSTGIVPLYSNINFKGIEKQ